MSMFIKFFSNFQGTESVDSSSTGFDAYKAQRELIIALENKNKEITKEINRIRYK